MTRTDIADAEAAHPHHLTSPGTLGDMSETNPSAQPSSLPAMPPPAAVSAPAAAAPAPRRGVMRRPGALAGLIAGGVLVLGIAFGGGVAMGWGLAGAGAGPASVQPGEMPGGGPGQGGPGFGPGAGGEQGTLPTRPDEQSDGTDDSGS